MACAGGSTSPARWSPSRPTGLDPRSRTEMWRVLRELVSGGTTLLLTTQYLEEADLLADDSADQLDSARALLAELAGGDVVVEQHTRKIVAPVSGAGRRWSRCCGGSTQLAERPGARHVGAAAPGDLHPHLGRADPGGLRPAVGAAVQAGRRPLAAIG